VDSKFTELQTASTCGNERIRGALSEILTDKGKNAMDAIRKVVNAMVSEETGLLDKRQRKNKTVPPHRADHHSRVL